MAIALTLAAISLAIGASSSIPAHAGGTLDNAVYKAVKEGKETKKVKTYNGHEFNIKPVTVTPKSGLSGFVVKGQLSHHLSFRSDDQFYYTVEIDRSGTILKFDEKIDRGGLTKMVLKLPVGELVPVRIDGAMVYDLTGVVETAVPQSIQLSVSGKQ